MNRLKNATSAYLQHAAHQKIDWYPWSEEAFNRARTEDKPVFLSSGAVWCHWCHVMARESFENQETADVMNKHFICIKLDRDQHPDIDRRYQQAVSAMGSGGGWPLSVFLTPEKKPFFGGTYFPPEDSHGRPGFRKVLGEVARFYRENQEGISDYTRKIMDFLRQQPLVESDIHEKMLDDAVRDMMDEYDSSHGGFGRSPKFPMPGALEFLLSRYFIKQDNALAEAVKKTLQSMAKGGFHDQLQGGFHRYSTDEAWTIPHFEKMADDNAWLLENYANAFAVFGDGYLKEAAEGIVCFLKEVLSDPEGGFYASQDADVIPEDEGGYFTWTADDFKKYLSDDEFRVLTSHFFDDRGSMHHDKAKKVLFAAVEPAEIAGRLGMDIGSVQEAIKTGKEKLLRERNRREAPFTDKTMYTSLNGMLISSCLNAYRSIPDAWLREFSLKTIDRVMKEYFDGHQLLHAQGVKAVLDDYIFFTAALVAAYEATGEPDYFNKAKLLMDICIGKLWDTEDGVFFDSEDATLDLRLKGIEDIPHPSANSLAVILLLKLHAMTDDRTYYNYAELSLKKFALKAKDMGIHAGYYYCALDAYFNMAKITVYAAPGGPLADAARRCFAPYKSIVYGEDKGLVVPCMKGVCYEPLQSPEGIEDFFRKMTHL